MDGDKKKEEVKKKPHMEEKNPPKMDRKPSHWKEKTLPMEGEESPQGCCSCQVLFFCSYMGPTCYFLFPLVLSGEEIIWTTREGYSLAYIRSRPNQEKTSIKTQLVKNSSHLTNLLDLIDELI